MENRMQTPMPFFLIVLVALTIAFFLLLGLRSQDVRIDRKAWKDLIELAKSTPDVFDPSLIQDLPEPAQRYFLYTIETGTSLKYVAEIEMGGQLGLGNKENPNYGNMWAHQILAPPHGLVWRLKSGLISGSDGTMPDISWTRFWLFGLVPVVRVGGDTDHHRSAFGRVISEGAFWVPASLLPSENVYWESVDNDTARAIITYGEFVQAVDITVAADGQPKLIVIQRWSDENAEKVFKYQPFGGYLSEFKMFDGYRLPTHVEGGNLIGTDDYFSFYKADVTNIAFPSILKEE